MRNPKVIAIVVASLAVLALIMRFTVFASRASDQQLIAHALEESLEASREGRAGGVLDLLSAKFKINQSAPGSRWDIARFIRENKPEVEIYNRNAVISGDSARIDTPVRVKLSYLNQNFDQQIDNVTLVFQKEEGRKYVFIPETEWRLTDVLVPNNAIPVNMSEEGGFSGFGGLGF